MKSDCFDAVNTVLDHRDRLLADPWRPGYHFALPAGDGMPGDPNGAFFADGRYHLMYLYRDHRTESYRWGHISSIDLLHWRSHPDALAGENGDGGCFSGGAFLDDDGTAYLTFWKIASADAARDPNGIALAKARPPYDVWERIRPIAIASRPDDWGVADIEVDGKVLPVACADPSNIWKKDGRYYLAAGGLCVLNRFGRSPGSDPHFRGDFCDLFRSGDLRSWQYLHRFYKRLEADGPADDEDNMCPSFLPLPARRGGGPASGTFLLLFIAHNRGAQYYLGNLEHERFLPTAHGRFSWRDNTCFAPEALVDARGRQLAWFWLHDDFQDWADAGGWRGVYSFPRELWVENGILHMAPAEELDRLEIHPQIFEPGDVDGLRPLPVKNGASFRLRAEIHPGSSTRAGFRLREDAGRGEYTDVYVDFQAGTLVFDATRSGNAARALTNNRSTFEATDEQGRARVRDIPGSLVEEAPFRLDPGEPLRLDLFVDRSVVEVYANHRQAIVRRVYPTDPAAALGVSALADGAAFGSIRCAEMAPANPC
ncbi:MAG: glycoside hydrolase family 32 protein [Kiritimatiellia bacterium]|jgi:beta-fructofuranosidase